MMELKLGKKNVDCKKEKEKEKSKWREKNYSSEYYFVRNSRVKPFSLLVFWFFVNECYI
jgi:hypothetical protein